MAGLKPGLNNGQLLGHLSMLGFACFVAGAFSLGGSVANEITPAALNTVRFWIAVGLIWALMKATGQGKRSDFVAPWRYLLLGGMYVTYFILMFEGLKTAAPVNMSVIFALTPFMSGIFGMILLRQVMSARIALALTIGGVGAVWVIFRGSFDALMAFEVGHGETLYFWGCVSHAIYTPVVRLLNRGEKVVPFAFGTLLAASVLITVYGFRDLLATDWMNLRPLVWVTIIYSAIFATFGSSLLLQFAAMRLPSSKVMAYTYLTPSWVIGWEMVRHGYVPPVLVLAGVAMTLIALLLLLRE